MAVRRVCFVGSGVIADVHAEALAVTKTADLAAVVEPHEARRQAFVRKWGVPQAYASLDEALLTRGFDAVHVLTPPDTHFEIAKVVIEAGLHAFIEKPVADTASRAQQLADLARARGVKAAVNQNFIHHPALAMLLTRLRRGTAGPARHISVLYNVPLRQLAGRQFGHWMFRRPGNILLEQLVHPLSQVLAIDPDLDLVSAHAPERHEISPGVLFYPALNATFASKMASAQVQFAVGRSFPAWQVIVVCDDAVLTADILANRFFEQKRTPWLEPVDQFLSGVHTATQIAARAIANASTFALALAKMTARSDPFFVSMSASIRAFYDALETGQGQTPPTVTDLSRGARIVALCEAAAKAAYADTSIVPPLSPKIDSPDVVILGGTGFIGAATTRRLLADGRRIRVMARNTTNLGDIFHQANVSVVRGDVTNPDDVRRAIEGAHAVINLAHGGASGSWQAIEAALVGSARHVGQACLDAKVERLVHVGSIAGLYAGDAGDVITGATPPDPRAEARADYARAKAAADHALLDLFRTRALPVCIVRPGLVVGSGASPFHSGLGIFNNEQFCLGWNAGENSLPFVLVDDVADAIVAAVAAPQAVGRAYNLVGDVRLSAREYIDELARLTRRPLSFRPGSVALNYAVEVSKWLIKRAVGRKVAPPSLRDLRSRGLVASFDCRDAKADLGWAPESDRAAFIKRAFADLGS